MKRMSKKARKVISIFVMLIFLSSAVNAFAAGEWVTNRNGFQNLANSDMAGNITSPSVLWNSYITGNVNSSINEFDVNNDTYKDIIIAEGGCVAALDRNFTELWKTSVINSKDVWGVFDLDNNGTYEIIVPCYKSLKIVAASNGAVLWNLPIANDLTYPRFRVEDVDDDNKMEVVFHVVQQQYLYCYTFKNGVANGTLKWSYYDDRPYESLPYNIGASPPEIAIADIDGDGVKEVAMASYGCRVDFLDARTGILEVSPSRTNWASSANGATAAADSEYQLFPNYPASKAIDGNVSSFWINNRTVPGWIQITFNGSKNIKYVNIFGAGGQESFNVQTWDGSQWVTQSTVSSNIRGQVVVEFDKKVYTNKIKINITQSTRHDGSGIYQCQMAEIQAYEELPDFNWALPANGATAAADSEYQPWPHYPASNAIDQNESVYWINNRVVPGWIQVNLYDSQSVLYVMLSGMNGTQAFNVQTWDGSQWVTQKSITGNTVSKLLLRFDSAVTTNKVRVNITQTTNNDGTGNGNQCQLSEIAVYQQMSEDWNYSSYTIATASADSEYQPWPNYPASKVIDGNTGTYWINNRAVPGWVQVEFTDNENIQYVDLYGLAGIHDFSVQTWDGSSWNTQATVSGNTLSQKTVKFAQKVLTKKIKVNITNSTASDGQGQGYQCQLAEIEAREYPKDFTTTDRKVEWHTNAPTDKQNGRNYGLFKLINIDYDDCLEAIIVADLTNRHVGVVDNSPHGSMLSWDRYIEYPDEYLIVDAGYDGVKDIDGDGRVEIVYSVYDDRITNENERWKLFILDAQTNVIEQTINRTYLKGIEDVNNDGRMELLVSEETTASPLDSSTIRVYSYSSGSYQSIWSKTNASFIVPESPCSGLPNYTSDGSQNQGKRPLLIDTDSNGVNEFFINDNGTFKAIDCTTDTVKWYTTEGTPVKVVSVFNNQDSQIITVNGSGQMKLIGENGAVLQTRNSGAGPVIIPQTADINNDGYMEMIVSDDVKTRVYSLSSTGTTFLWENTGRSMMNQANENYFAAVYDMNGDNYKDIILRDVNANGEPMIKVVNYDNTTLWSYTFSGFGSNDIYQWMIGDYNGDSVKDIYVALNEGQVNGGRSRIINGATHTLMWSLDSVEWDPVNYPGQYRGFAPSLNPGATKDVDGDGMDELIIVALDMLYKCDWNGTTMVLTQKISYHDIYYSLPMIANVDNSGSLEYVIGSSFWNFSVLNSSLNRIWQIDTPRFDLMRRAQGIADVDNDNVMEAAIEYLDGTNANKLVCHNAANGSVEWSFDLKADVAGSGDIIVKDIAAADIDGDGRKEYILTTNTGYLYAINGEANPLTRVSWKINIGTELASPIITDIDGDGYAEVLVFGGDGKMYAVN